jgi:MATE family multidrug resistance protein
MKSDLRFRRILNIAIPISLANATIPILGAVDTGVIGQTGDPVLIAAVSVGAIIVSVSFWVFGFLRMGTTGLASQARGELDNFELVSILLRGIIVGLLSGCILIIAQVPLISGSLKIFQAAADVETLATDYFKIRIWSAPFSISTFAMIG